jgi:hypothetical protein
MRMINAGLNAFILLLLIWASHTLFTTMPLMSIIWYLSREEINFYNSGMPKLDYNKKYKTQFCFEEYLNIDLYRMTIYVNNLCSHSLEMETGIYMRTDRNNLKLCKLYSYKNVESEYHFLLCCPFYSELRKSFIKHVSFPTLSKFYVILSTEGKSRILQYIFNVNF